MAKAISPVLLVVSKVRNNRSSSASIICLRSPARFDPLPYRCSVGSSSRSIYCKPFKVQAALLQDETEKLQVEDSLKNIGGQDGKRSIEEMPLDNPSSSRFERMIIKLEQSINIFLTDSVIKILDTLYQDRNYARFFVLETIARVPYFAFISILHLYESCGWWRRADYLKVHFAESWNEMHHLLIMEELGGNSLWFDRFLAQHVAIIYYFVTVLMYAISPRMAYHFSECVESHAFETYDKYLKAYGDELKNLPAPGIAVRYYTGGDLYLFDEFQTSREPNTRRPTIENLYDVFINIRDDEAEHCKTMKACQAHGNLKSPHSSSVGEGDDDLSGCLLSRDCEGIVDCIKKSVIFSQTTER